MFFNGKMDSFIWISQTLSGNDGWAGSESTFGAAAVSSADRDLTGGGEFGIPGYAGVGASGLGWGVQDGFDEFVDPPATVNNVRFSALASRPSRPFFMVGSSNTHIYL